MSFSLDDVVLAAKDAGLNPVQVKRVEAIYTETKTMYESGQLKCITPVEVSYVLAYAMSIHHISQCKNERFKDSSQEELYFGPYIEWE